MLQLEKLMPPPVSLSGCLLVRSVTQSRTMWCPIEIVDADIAYRHLPPQRIWFILQMACEELIYVNYEHDTDAVSVGSLSTAVSLCAAVSAGMREMSNS